MPILLPLMAPDTPEDPGPACAHPQMGACWMRAVRQRHDERQDHKCKLAQGICLRICNKFLLQCCCDFFLTLIWPWV